jgi:hypothetical protein
VSTLPVFIYLFLCCPDLARWSLVFGHLLPSLLVPFCWNKPPGAFKKKKEQTTRAYFFPITLLYQCEKDLLSQPAVRPMYIARQRHGLDMSSRDEL